MKYRDLRDFITGLESSHELRRVSAPVSPQLEMTALCDRVLRQGGPALLFVNPTGYRVPVLANLFGTPRRVALGMRAIVGPACLVLRQHRGHVRGLAQGARRGERRAGAVASARAARSLVALTTRFRATGHHRAMTT